MLIGIIEVLEHPKGMLVCGSSSMVRLHPLDDCMRVGGKALYHGTRSGFVSLGSLKDGKLILSRGLLLIKNNELTNQMVKGRPQLICDFTCKQEQLEGWVREATTHRNESNYSRFEVTLYPNGVGVRFKGNNISHELIEVLHGPFNLGIDSI